TAQRSIERFVRRGVQAHQPDHGVDFVDRAVGLDPEVVFLTPRTGAERGGTVVASPGINAVEHNHIEPRWSFAGSEIRSRLYIIFFLSKKGGGPSGVFGLSPGRPLFGIRRPPRQLKPAEARVILQKLRPPIIPRPRRKRRKSRRRKRSICARLQ